jgi:hypothetical protein
VGVCRGDGGLTSCGEVRRRELGCGRLWWLGGGAHGGGGTRMREAKGRRPLYRRCARLLSTSGPTAAPWGVRVIGRTADGPAVHGAARDRSVRRMARGGLEAARGRVRPGEGAGVPREGAPTGPGRRGGGRDAARACSGSNVLVCPCSTVFFSKFIN